ncbi:hypothetical protein [Sphingomicrobium aestuariivivum]|uniref:hypothetical protein n=1 Tax=Sphingomicrobium aestuariivivum TaxID=1582356 RepID=UPI001FD6C8C3|nr:hypothetical protein [Sphingomicrobium aestuariivivum]MCJ8190493.1 hypothetical protein [Sphingomicrobium aestuariivivum]
MKPDPTAVPRRRPYSAADFAVFLEVLALTGNVALAAAAIHRPKAGLYKRRASDPAFAAKWTAALAAFHTRPAAREGTWTLAARLAQHGDAPDTPVPVTGRSTPASEPAPLPPLRYLPASGQRRAQIRRTAANGLTPAREAAFLAALACTGNVRLAADSIGIAPSSIPRRRKVDPAFAARFEEALECAEAVVEDLMVERFFLNFDIAHRIKMTGTRELEEAQKLTTGQALQFLYRMDRKG